MATFSTDVLCSNQVVDLACNLRFQRCFIDVFEIRLVNLSFSGVGILIQRVFLYVPARASPQAGPDQRV